MRRITTILALLLAFAGAAIGADRYFGGDTTGVSASYPLWYSKLTAAVTASTTAEDSLYAIGASEDSLSSLYNWTKNLYVDCGGYSVRVIGSYILFNGNTGSKIVDADPFMACLNGAAGAADFEDLAIVMGDSTAQYGSGFAMRFTGATGTYTFTDCTFETEVAALDEIQLHGTGELNLSFTGGEMGGMWLYAADVNVGTDCTLDIDGLTYSHSKQWFLPADFQRVTLTDLIWTPDTPTSNGYIDLFQYDTLLVTGGQFLKWGVGSANNSALFDLQMPVASADLSARYTSFTDLSVAPTVLTNQASFAAIRDTTEASEVVIDGVVIGQSGAAKDSLLYAFLFGQHEQDVAIGDLSIYAGAFAVFIDDTSRAVGSHTCTGTLTIDHTDWGGAAASGLTAAFQWVGNDADFANPKVHSPLSHTGLMGDDNATGTQWDLPGCYQRFASGNTFTGYDFKTLGLYVGRMYGWVDKAKSNRYLLGNGETEGGTTGSSIFFFVGDSTLLYNSLLTNGGAGAGSSMIDTGAYGDHQSDSLRIENNIFVGEADTVYVSSSGDGSGLNESHNNYVDLTYDLLDLDGQTLASSSFDAATGLTAADVARRNLWAGKHDLPGIVQTPGGLAGIGPQTATASAQLSDPGIGWGNPEFETPVLSRQTLASWDVTGATLYHNIRTLADQAAYDEWLHSRVIQADSTDARAVQTVIPRY